MKVKVTQSCTILWNPMELASSVRGILQARILDWVAIPFFKETTNRALSLSVYLCRLSLL